MAYLTGKGAQFIAHPTVGPGVPAYVRRNTNNLIVQLDVDDVLGVIAELSKNFQDNHVGEGVTLVIESDEGFYPKDVG